MPGDLFQSIVVGVLSGGVVVGVVVGVAAFFAKRWVVRVEQAPEKMAAELRAVLNKFEARMDRYEASLVSLMSTFCTKTEFTKAIEEQRECLQDQSSHIDGIDKRLTAVEVTCKMNHRD